MRNGLPKPGSTPCAKLIPNQAGRRIYEELFAAPDGLDIHELKARVPEYAQQMHFDRRLRDLDKVFILKRIRSRGRFLYQLRGLRQKAHEPGRVSKTLRARILFRDGSRCQMCGASPQRSPEVMLEVDHKLPLHLGGSNGEENLWTLCKTCNEGKRAFFSSANKHAKKIKAAIHHPEVHRRLGTLLQAFGLGKNVPSYLLEMVASAQQYQEDWHRRLRELRDLGWDYEVTKRKEGNRFVTYYRLTKDGGWPQTGTLRQALRTQH
ncbi:HNH endonuclease [Stigmatella sp. ncwal1]|uniref:HNH endonuclease n=1 Tax=Stigmatella ashevillensis TaxID=2995309 RepID=A0ABT5DES9_9BACT|nr:HNH endonuclease [Stigmatella ashevillena]MDC0712084.1 HNH endonuclease [Stigmatella ashevillena]